MGSQPLIANDLLAFIKYAIDYMGDVSILQICMSSFKEEEICSGKLLLFQTLGKLDQMTSRRRDGGEKNVQDIITLMRSTDPDNVPDFVGKDLYKLPPATFEHVDIIRLLKDIASLKASLVEVQCKLETSNNTIDDLRTEVQWLRNTVPLCGSPDVFSNVNTRCGVQNASLSSFVSVNATASSDARKACVAFPAVVAASAPAETVTHVGTLTPKRAYSAVVAVEKPAKQKIKLQAGTRNGGKQSCSNIAKQQCPNKDTVDKDGFIKVEKKKRRPCRNQCGTALAGPNMLLRPAIPTTQLYVSRLHHSTKVEDIVEYLRVKTNWTLRVEKLESRHNTNFKSFVVRVPTHHLQTFLNGEFWPKGVVYRRFRGTLHDTTQRNTTPSLRVH